MITLEKSAQDLSEAILTTLGICEKFVKFRNTLLVMERYKPLENVRNH